MEECVHHVHRTHIPAPPDEVDRGTTQELPKGITAIIVLDFCIVVKTWW